MKKGAPDTSPSVPLEQRLDRLELQLEEISGVLERLEKRLSSLDGTPVEAEIVPEPVESALAPVLPQQGAILNLLTRLGRSFLIFGGAFLIRWLTDSGTLPRPTGAALGLAYAVLWILLADRIAGRGHASSAVFLGITAVLIAYPLIAETSTRFAVFTTPAAAAAVTALTGLCLAVAWRRNLPALAWISWFAAVLTAFALSLVTGAVEPFAAALLVIGLVTVWLGYGHRHWHGLRWPAAAAADALVLWTALRLVSPEIASPGKGPSVILFFLLAFALPFLYMGSFALRTLARRRDVTVFEVVQTVAALAIGFGGAAAVARHVKDAQVALGLSALVIAAGCYGIAFVFIERQAHRRNFHFYATLALLLTLSGSALAAGSVLLGFSWCGLALASALLATRFARVTLAVHSAVYAVAAAWQTGLLSASFDSFLARGGGGWAPFGAASLLALGTAAASYVLLTREKREESRAGERFPRAMLAALVAFGAGALVVWQLRGLAGIDSDPGAIAALRTAVLAVAAFLLAAARGRTALPELGWLAYTVLVLGAAKLLVEDLPGGRPSTLFVGFAFYGAALLVTPRLLRSAVDPGAAQRTVGAGGRSATGAERVRTKADAGDSS